MERAPITTLAKDLAIVGAAGATYGSGLAALTRNLTRSKIPILTYHSVSDFEGEEPSCLDLTRMRVRRKEFRRQMEYLARHYHTITLEDLLRARSGHCPLEPNPCIITFDDGYLDTYENAVPVLEELGLKATFFVIGRTTRNGELSWLHAVDEILDTVPTPRCASVFQKAARSFFAYPGAVSKDELCRDLLRYFDEHPRSDRTRFLHEVRAALHGESPRKQRFLDASHITALHKRGFEIGCHSMEHDPMAQLSDAELLADIRQCKEVLAEILGRPPRIFCYPIGSFDGRVINALAREGFACAVTTIPGLNDMSTDPFVLHRMMVFTDTSFQMFVFRLVGLEAKSHKLYGLVKSVLRRSHSVVDRGSIPFDAASDARAYRD